MGNSRIGMIHLRQSFKGLRLKLGLLCLALFLFQMLFAVLATSVKIQQDMVTKLDTMPKMAQKMMGEGFIESVIKYGVITMGYLHPFMLVIIILFIIMSVSQIVTSEIGYGSIGFTLSKPLSRRRIYFNMGVIIYIGTALLAFSTYLSTFLGIQLFHSTKMSVAPFFPLAWDLFLVMIFIAGYVALFAAISDNSKRLFTLSGVTLFVFYLLSFATPLWSPLEYLAPVSPFYYFKPMAILMGNRLSWETSVTLTAVSVLMFTVAAFLFNRRDIASG